MPPWKKRLVAVMYGEMARKPPQVPEPFAICWVDGGESPVSQTKKGETVKPLPGLAVRRAERSQPSAPTDGFVVIIPCPPVPAEPTVPNAAPAVKRTSPQLPTSSRPEAPSQPRLELPPPCWLSRVAMRREAAR